MSEFLTELKRIVRQELRTAYGIPCKVDSVDGSTCDVSPVDGSSPITAVRLQAETKDGILISPKVGSTVLVKMINDSDGVVVMFGEVEPPIKFFDGAKGLTDAATVTTKLNNLETMINALYDALNTWVPVPTDGGTALKTALTAWLTSGKLTATNQSEVEDKTEITY